MNVLRWGALLLLTLSLANCAKDDDDDPFALEGPGGINMNDMAGNWVAQEAVFSRLAGGPASSIDVVELGGGLSMAIQADGRFTVTLILPDGSSETSTGRMGFFEDILNISFDDDPEEWESYAYELDEPNLTIEGGPVYEAIDFDSDGVAEDANISLYLIRD